MPPFLLLEIRLELPLSRLAICGGTGKGTMGRFLFVGLGLLVVAFSLTGAQRTCLKGWYSRNSYCHKVFREQKSWNDAKVFCEKQGKFCHLATIRRKLERDDMADYVSENLKSGQSVWIGLNDPRKKGEWQWLSHNSLSYLAWADGKPDRSKDSNKFCAKLEKETGYFQWSDSNCEELYPFLCRC